MSAAEGSINTEKARRAPRALIGDRILDFLSSVRFGVVLLCTLVLLSIVGMLVMQQNVEGFEAYYVSLTPAEKLVFARLGIFDIYHSWYFNLLLLVLSLNIILASIDRFPSAWSYIVKPKLQASRDWLLGRKQTLVMSADSEDRGQVAEAIAGVFRRHGYAATITEAADSIHVFGQRGKWNRIGAYIVHVFLLTLFLGHFVALQTGFDADVRMVPGETTDQIQMIQFDLDKKAKFNVQIPFSLTCLDIEQKLVDPAGGIDVTNTMDWRTRMRIADPEYGEAVVDVSLNKPFSYRGYRFFQAQTIPVGNARNIRLTLTPQQGGDPVMLELPRGGSTVLGDGTSVEYEEFLPDFTFNERGQADTRSGEYVNPVAVLGVTPKDGARTRVFAFSGTTADNIPVGAPKAGYKWRLTEFEKSPYAHILSIKYDPYEGAFIAWYIGGFGLIGALVFVFFVSHRRIWARISAPENGNACEIVLAGEANRNHSAFEDRFNRIVDSLRGTKE